jgi:Mrp family chromosome partitioning ATPase
MKIDQFPDPYLGLPWQALGARMLSSGDHVSVTLGYPAQGLAARLARELAEFLGVASVDLDLRFRAPQGRGPGPIRNIIAVASGKGGVGKSTTAVNLALALEKEGARVGLLDADIYGPSQGMMLGVPEGPRPEVKDGKFFVPIKAHGIQAMSMSFLITESTPMVWRGPMVSGALQQLLGQTLWDDLDYLIVDMPPGTGDIQLTLSQRVPVAGAVIVTTPQDIALLDAARASRCSARSTSRCSAWSRTWRCSAARTAATRRRSSAAAAASASRRSSTRRCSAGCRSICGSGKQADGGTPTVARDPDGPLRPSIAKRPATWRRGCGPERRRQGGRRCPEISMTDD